MRIFIDIDGVMSIIDNSLLVSENYVNPRDPNSIGTWYLKENHEFAKHLIDRGEFLLFDTPHKGWCMSNNPRNLGLYPFMFAFTRQSVKALNAITLHSDDEIVISSEWRMYHSLDWLQRLFKVNCVISDVVDTTSKSKYSDNYVNNRIIQILSYIEKNQITDYRIYDDLPLNENTISDISEQFHRTVFYLGLTFSDVTNKITL
jgi:hypothetical protein